MLTATPPTLKPIPKPYCLQKINLQKLANRTMWSIETNYILNHKIGTSRNFNIVWNSILKLIRTSPSSIFNCENYKAIKLVTRLLVFVCINTKSNIVFRMHWIQSRVMVLKMNEFFSTFCTVQRTMIKVILSWLLWKAFILYC